MQRARIRVDENGIEHVDICYEFPTKEELELQKRKMKEKQEKDIREMQLLIKIQLITALIGAILSILVFFL
ncbi:hypothetical protein [Clostridium baratii]|uniref:hypothetical protein n=1 Tax=Clostridium baratii TaxID=1561 RepID=UPI0030CB77D1